MADASGGDNEGKSLESPPLSMDQVKSFVAAVPTIGDEAKDAKSAAQLQPKKISRDSSMVDDLKPMAAAPDASSSTADDLSSSSCLAVGLPSKSTSGPPCRPKAAYNIFFESERKKILKAHEQGDTPPDFIISPGKEEAGDEQARKRYEVGLVAAVAKTVRER